MDITILILLVILLIGFLTRKREFTSPSKPTDKAASSKQNLAGWYLLILVVFIGGMVAYVYDIKNPSEIDRYEGTNESALMIAAATTAVLVLLGICARFSYQKFSRVNQADLIAEAIRSQVQPQNTNPPTWPPAPQNSMDPDARLRKLASLLADGLISNDDFETKKQQILDSL
jgi:hypothetical protein